MKNFYLLTKTLLMAVMLMGEANLAWGETTWKTDKSWDLATGYAATDTVGIKPTNYWTPSGTGTSATMSLATTISSATAITENSSSRYYGLLFQADKSKMTLSSGGVTLGGGATKITIPNLKKGQRITVTVDHADGMVRDASSTATLENFSTSSAGDSRWKTQGVVTTGGDLVIKRSAGNTFRVKSILVETPYTEVLTMDFEDADTYTNGWSINGDLETSQGTVSGSSTKTLCMKNLKNGNRAFSSSYNSTIINVASLYNYIYEFDFNYGRCNSNATGSTLTVQSNNSAGKLFTIDKQSIANNSDFKISNSAGTVLTATALTGSTSYNSNAFSSLYHFYVEGIKDDGVYLTVTTGSTISMARTKVADFAPLTGLHSNMGKNATAVAFDNICYAVDISDLKKRAEDALDNCDAIVSEVMNSTVYSTLNSAYSTLTTDYDTEEEIVANVVGYYNAIVALETANENAQTSINDFIILNDLITRANTFAETVTSYEAPEGASTVYTSNADVDPVALAAAVRAEVIEEGVKNDDTDITAIIINSEFELNSTLGWTIAGDAATAPTDLDKYGATESNGSGGYQYYTGWNGRNISQIIPSLPAGKYRLTARVKSWSGGAPVRLFGNGTLSAAENGDDHTPTLEFTTTGIESNVKIGIGGTGKNNDTDNTWGTWGYKIDYFTLTYVGQDELALAKASLAEEIETATALYGSWTPKVGTTPFKYDATYYNALNTAIEAAQDVIDADGDVVSAYTSAEDALETAESNMASSTQNAPDPDKYYQIFVANNDGTASDYNLYMLKETTKTQVKVSATPYPVKFEAITSGTYAGRYYINTPYSHHLCSDKTATTTAYVSSGEGVESRCDALTLSLQEDGSVKISGTKSGTSHYYTANASNNAGVTVTTTSGSARTWVISDAVDVTDVNLAVNATTGWGTFIAPYENLIPSTVKAYTVSHKGSGYIYLEENETGVLSANTPYILSTEEVSNVSVAFKGIADADEDTYEDNGLVGLLAAKTVPANSYILQYQAGKVGTAFYKLASDMTGTKYRCYLDLENVPASSSSRATVSMSIFGDEATGIQNLTPALSEGEGVVYNLRGQRVAQPTKGLYIVNGKKVVIK